MRDSHLVGKAMNLETTPLGEDKPVALWDVLRVALPEMGLPGSGCPQVVLSPWWRRMAWDPSMSLSSGKEGRVGGILGCLLASLSLNPHSHLLPRFTEGTRAVG